MDMPAGQAFNAEADASPQCLAGRDSTTLVTACRYNIMASFTSSSSTVTLGFTQITPDGRPVDSNFGRGMFGKKIGGTKNIGWGYCTATYFCHRYFHQIPPLLLCAGGETVLALKSQAQFSKPHERPQAHPPLVGSQNHAGSLRWILGLLGMVLGAHPFPAAQRLFPKCRRQRMVLSLIAAMTPDAQINRPGRCKVL